MEYDEFGNFVLPSTAKIFNPNTFTTPKNSFSALAELNRLGPQPGAYNASDFGVGSSSSWGGGIDFSDMSNSMRDYLGSSANGLSGAQREYLDRMKQISNPKWSEMGFGQKVGTVGTGLQALSGLGSAYLGFKNLSLAKQNMRQQNEYSAVNLANQAKLANQALEGNIRSRYAGGPTAAETDEMNRYRLQGTVGGKG